MLKQNRALTAAVLLGCFVLFPYHAHADDAPEYGTPVAPHQTNIINIDVDGAPFAKLDVYTNANDAGGYYTGEANTDGSYKTSSFRDFLWNGDEPQYIAAGMKYLTDMLGQPKSELYIELALYPEKDANASAYSIPWFNADTSGNPSQISDSLLAAVYHGKYPLEKDELAAFITINDANEWYVDKFPVLPSNGTDSDYYGTITHEMFHALGLQAAVYEDADGKLSFGTVFITDDGALSPTIFRKYELGLKDVSGNSSYYYDADGVLQSKIIKPITSAELADIKNGTLKAYPNAFYAMRDTNAKGNFIAYSGVYFTGEHVLDALTTNGQTAKIAWPDGYDLPAVEGLPINGFEGYKDYLGYINGFPDFSHIELQNSLMSHQAYRNWCTFMEAEIALLQDLGFDIDRKKYFGKSIYNSGTADKYFTFNNTNGFDSAQTHGVGLHVYGSYVDVTQSAALNAAGAYGIGIRIDGANNKLKIDSDISANGEGGNGLLAAYGKEHDITLASGHIIQAMGKDGVAARFDFGSNELSDIYEYRGSYIDVAYDEDNKKWYNISTHPEAIKGELVTSFNVNGALAGKLAAVYISPNAYVKNINIMKGAFLQGDIISEWNPKQIIYQNESGSAVLKPAIPDNDPYQGVTALTFGAQANEDGSANFYLDENGTSNYIPDAGFNLRYDGNITGANGINMHIVGGELEYNGAAKVNAITIYKDATLSGNGAYTLGETSDGTFANNGTFVLGKGEGVTGVNIDGNYTQSPSGALGVHFLANSATDALVVSGTAKIDGTINLLPTQDYFANNAKMTLNDADIVHDANGDISKVTNNANYALGNASPTLNFSMERDGQSSVITTGRDDDAYSQYAVGNTNRNIGQAFDVNAGNVTNKDAQNLVAAVDFSGSGQNVNAALGKLNPSIYNSSAQATLNIHHLLNNLVVNDGIKSQVPDLGESAAKEPVAYGSWRNSIMPFYSYTDQHNDAHGYASHDSGVVGAMERTLDNGLTHGYHAAINHQNVSEGGNRVKGEGLYLGAQAHYAPTAWNGWQLFGGARLGVEQMRSHRRIGIGSYAGSVDADWTGYSGSLKIGAALEKEHGVMQSGPFAALDYSFAHRPSVHENGGAIRANLSSETYDSLRTQVGYRLATKPKALDNYDSTQWQAHAAVAWNHELLDNNGRTSYQLADFANVTITDTAAAYGRDSMSLAAGVTFKTPKNLDVTLSLGGEMYRKGGSSIYGNVGLEWKF